MNDKIFISAVAIILIVAGLASFTMLSSGSEALLVASGHEDWAPVMFHNGNGSIVGKAPAFVEEALSGSPYEVECQYAGSWDIVQNKAKNGDIDIIVAAYRTSEREKYLLFTEPFISDPIGIFVTDGNLLLMNIEEIISSKEGIVTAGDSYGEKIDNLLKGANLFVAANPEEAKAMLISGEGDYFLYSSYAGEKLFSSNPEVYTSVVGEELFYVGVSKENPDAEEIVQILNDYIERNSLLT